MIKCSRLIDITRNIGKQSSRYLLFSLFFFAINCVSCRVHRLLIEYGHPGPSLQMFNFVNNLGGCFPWTLLSLDELFYCLMMTQFDVVQYRFINIVRIKIIADNPWFTFPYPVKQHYKRFPILHNVGKIQKGWHWTHFIPSLDMMPWTNAIMTKMPGYWTYKIQDQYSFIYLFYVLFLSISVFLVIFLRKTRF